MPVARPNAVAWMGVMTLRTSGRFLVRVICASKGTSWIWLKVLAEAEQSAVPKAVDRRTGTDAGRGERATPDMAVRTTRTDRRDLES